MIDTSKVFIGLSALTCCAIGGYMAVNGIDNWAFFLAGGGLLATALLDD